VYIEKRQPGKRPRFLILVQRDGYYEDAPCPTCFGFGRVVVGRDVLEAEVVRCYNCQGVGTKPQYMFPREIRAFVRCVTLRQSGHFMSGYAYVFGRRLYIEGAYGSNGLPITVSLEVFDKAVPLPDVLREAWNKGDGWNSAGSEASLLRQWALDNIKQLAPGRSPVSKQRSGHGEQDPK
jgi:hypothetical protein